MTTTSGPGLGAYEEQMARVLRPVAPPRVLENVYSDDQFERLLRIVKREGPWPTIASHHFDTVDELIATTTGVVPENHGLTLDDIDGESGGWTSDSPAFRELYELCRPHLASDFHRQPDALGRREFFADAFAAISSRPSMVRMFQVNATRSRQKPSGSKSAAAAPASPAASASFSRSRTAVTTASGVSSSMRSSLSWTRV